MSSKPVPDPDPESKPFWDALVQHRLMVQECAACNARRYPATTFCPVCRSNDSRWIESGGTGKVFSWVVVHHPVPKEAYAAEVPYVVALIDLDEGVRMVSNIVNTDLSSIQANMRVKVRFDDVEPGVTLPRFVPA